MAVITQLTRVISQELAIPEPTVLLHARLVREAGFLTQGGRGRSAARMTPTDAAVVLIACATARNVKDTVEVTRDYLDLEGERATGWFDLPPEVRQPPIRFVEALAWFIEFAGLFPVRPAPPDMSVKLYGPMPIAKIEYTTADKVTVRDIYQPFFRTRQKRAPLGDLTFRATLTHITIFTVGALLAGKYPGVASSPGRVDPTMPRDLELRAQPRV